MSVVTGRGPVRSEAEVKLLAPADLELPSFEGVLEAVTARPHPVRRLEAVYFDTADLRLARAGSTLRFRDEGGTSGWTAKLAGSQSGSLIVRREVSLPGTRDHLPEKLRDLLTATARGAVLEQVATVTTLRRNVELLDEKGRTLVEISDDRVTAAAEGHPVQDFREVEAELMRATRSGRRALEAVVARLVAAGCTKGPPTPKLVRSLGERAGAPPDVVVVPAAHGDDLEAVVRRAVARSVAQLLAHDPGVRLGTDPEETHQLRVATRRLRSDLRSFSKVLDADLVAPVRDELGWLGGEIRALRDADVLAERLAASAARLGEPDRFAASLLLDRLSAETVCHRAELLAAMRSPRYLLLLDALVDLAAAPPLREKASRADPVRLAAAVVRKRWRRLERAARAVGPDAPDAALHEVRILAKRCRYVAEAVAPLVGDEARRFAAAVASVQDLLGEHQDTVVAEAWLRTTAEHLEESRLAAGELVAAERLRRGELRREWPAAWERASAASLRRWLRR